MRSSLLAACLLGLATSLVYLPALRGGFIWDDNVYLYDNPLVRDPGGLPDIWLGGKTLEYYPLFTTFCWLQWRLFGLNPSGYHAVNVLLHILCVLLLWRVLTRLRVAGAWWGALLFAIHPVNVESVAWISEMKNTLSMALGLAALTAWLRFEEHGRRRDYLGALLLFLLALLSKTTIVVLPIILLGLVWWQRGRILRLDLMRTIPFFALALVLGIVLVRFLTHPEASPELVRHTSLPVRLYEGLIAIGFYAAKALFPAGLCLVYPHWPSGAARLLALGPTVVLSGLMVAIWHWRPAWRRGVILGLGTYVATLVPALGFIYHPYLFQSPAADRWQYLGLIGITGLVAAGAVSLYRESARSRFWLRLAAVGVIGSLAVATSSRAGLFAHAERLYRSTLACNPRAAIVGNNLGIILMQQGRYAEALDQLTTVVEQLPAYGDARSNLATALVKLGRPAEAEVQLKEALRLRPDLAMAHFNLGALLAQQGRLEEASERYQAGLELAPTSLGARRNLADLLIRQGRPAAAEPHLRELLRQNPEQAPVRYWLARVLAEQGKNQQAQEELLLTVRDNPGILEAYVDLATLYQRSGQPGQAVRFWREAVSRQPDLPQALAGLAWLLATSPDSTLRNAQEALTLARKLVRLSGENLPPYLEVLAAAYAESGKFAEAAATARACLELSDEDTDYQERIRRQLALYEAGKPYRDAAAFRPVR